MKTEDDSYQRMINHYYWLFRWGYQRIIVNHRYRKLERQVDNKPNDNIDTHNTAHEELIEAQFACKYGKTGNCLLREFATYLEDNNIITQPEIRRLIQSGDLGQTKKGGIYIKPPYRVVIGSVIFVFFNALAIILFSYFIPGIPTSLHYKITLLLIYYGMLFCGTYVFRFYTVLPYRALKILPSVLETFLIKKAIGDKPIRLIR